MSTVGMELLDTEAIYKWIDTYQFSRQKKNISRDFSDAVPLAEILKTHFPKLVELHNYTPKNSFAQKLINWTTLQRKVLSKLKLHLSKSTLEELARAEPGVIERVLGQVKYVIEKHDVKEKDTDVYIVEGLDEDEIHGSILPIKMKQGTKISDQKIVPAQIFDDMLGSIDEKDRHITDLENKIKHLEKIIKIKDERIVDLQNQVQTLSDQHQIGERFINEIS